MKVNELLCENSPFAKNPTSSQTNFAKSNFPFGRFFGLNFLLVLSVAIGRFSEAIFPLGYQTHLFDSDVLKKEKNGADVWKISMVRIL